MKCSDLKKEIRKQLKLKKQDNDLDLITHNILDSINIVTLVSYIEKKIKLKCDLYKIDNKNFSSVNKIILFLFNYLKYSILFIFNN